MEALILFIFYIGFIMSAVFLLCCIYFSFCFVKEVIKLITRYFKAKRDKKLLKRFNRKIIKDEFEAKMLYLKFSEMYPEIFKEVLKDEKSENLNYPVRF